MPTCAHLCSATAPVPSPATATPSVKPKSVMSTSLRAAVLAVPSPCAGTVEAVGSVRRCAGLGVCWHLAVAHSCVQGHTGDFGGKAVMPLCQPSACLGCALEGHEVDTALLPSATSELRRALLRRGGGSAEMLWGAEVAAVLPAAGICSSTALHYPAVSGSLCQTRNKVSSQLPGVLATQGHSQDASCSEQEPGRSFECSSIWEGLPLPWGWI